MQLFVKPKLTIGSIFLARVQVYSFNGQAYDPNGSDTSDHMAGNTLTTAGYSPKGIVASIVLGSAMVFTLIAMGFRRYHGNMPVAANNSVAIAAACHPPEADHDVATSEVMWGAVRHENTVGETIIPGHCCFTSEEVEKPIVDLKYE